jgi:hypothetical protein
MNTHQGMGFHARASHDNAPEVFVGTSYFTLLSAAFDALPHNRTCASGSVDNSEAE